MSDQTSITKTTTPTNNNEEITTTASAEAIGTLDTTTNDDASSIKSTTSTTSINKISGIKPPSTTLSRIGRPCQAHHQPKAGPPPPTEHTNDINPKMRRQSDEYSRSNLPDVFEESEADLVKDISNRSKYSTNRSSKSKSPDNLYSKPPRSDRKISNGSMGSDLYWEATGRRRSSDHGVALTTDTDSFIIGQRVWVGGCRPGHIAYIGETHFAPGDWAGVVLDDTSGKNDGCVSGKRYFQCEPKRGIFSRLTRLTHEQISGGVSASDMSMNYSTRSITSPSRSGTISPTHSMKSWSVKAQQTKNNMTVGDRVIVSSGLGSRAGILQFIGETKFAAGHWCGVQLDEPTGKNDGSVDGVKYFDCPQPYGIFVPLAKVTLSPSARKPRLSRSGSKESLTSVGTFASIPSTATSRLRMSAQRLSNSNNAKPPITTPKNAFSLQDVLREKQNHIEQLLVEKDLDRQDAEHQAILHQKTINQLHDKVKKLEVQLEDEKRRAEDLQFSIDEVTICGDELNIKNQNQNLIDTQLQEYKDRIVILENQLQGSTIKDGIEILNNNNDSIIKDNEQQQQHQHLVEENEKLKIDLSIKNEIIAKLNDSQNESIVNINNLGKQLKEMEINGIETIKNVTGKFEEQCAYLQQQNEQLIADLEQKDIAKEKEYLNMKNIENELREDVNNLREKLNENKLKLTNENTEENNRLNEKHNELLIEHKRQMQMLTEQHEKLLNEKNYEFNTITNENTKKIENLLQQIEINKKENEFMCKNYEEQLMKLQSDNSKSIQQITDETQCRVTELQQSMELYKTEKETSVQQSIELTKTMSTHQQQLAELQSQNLTLHNELDTIKLDVNVKNDSFNKLSNDYESMNLSHQNELVQLQEQNLNLEQQIIKLEKFKIDNETVIGSMKQDLFNTNALVTAKDEQITSDNLEIKKLQNSNAIFSKELMEQKQLAVEIEKRFNELQTKSTANDEKLSKMEIDNDDLKRKLSNSEQQREQAIQENSELQETIKNLQNSAFDSSSEYVRLQKQMQEKLIENKHMNEEIQKINLNLQKSVDELNKQLELKSQELEKQLQTIEKLNNEKLLRETEFNLEIQKIHSENENKQKKLMNEFTEQLTGANSIRCELNESLEKLENTVKQLENDIKQQQNDFHAKEDEFNSRINTLNTMEMKLMDKLKLSEENELSLKKSLEQISDTSGRNYDELLNSYNVKELHINNLQTQLTTLNETVKKTELEKDLLKSESNESKLKYENLIENLNKEIDKIFNEKNNLEKELQMKNIKFDDDAKLNLNSKLQNTITLFTILQERKSELEQQNLQLTQQITEFELNSEKFKRIAKQNEEQLKNDLEKCNFEFTQKIQQSELELEQSKNELKSKIDVIKNFEQEIENLKLSSNNLSDDIKKELLQKSEELKIKNCNISDLNSTLIELQNQIKDLEEHLNKIRIERETENQKSLNELNLKDIEIKKCCDKISELENTLQNVQQQFIEKEKQFLLEQNQRNDEEDAKKNSIFDKLKQEFDEMEKSKRNEIEMLTLKSWDFEEQLNQQTNALEKCQQANEQLKSIELKEKLYINENEKLKLDLLQLQIKFDEQQQQLKNKISKIPAPSISNSNNNKQPTNVKAEGDDLSSKVSGGSDVNTINVENENGAQISFLNSIIADMQKKNETLLLRIQTLEAVPIDFMNDKLFQIPTRRQPAPRLFCDICDKFDSHDTEDCPLQSSNNSPPYFTSVLDVDAAGGDAANGTSSIQKNADGTIKERKLPPPRIYCENCETFDDHGTYECSITF